MNTSTEINTSQPIMRHLRTSRLPCSIMHLPSTLPLSGSQFNSLPRSTNLCISLFNISGMSRVTNLSDTSPCRFCRR